MFSPCRLQRCRWQKSGKQTDAKPAVRLLANAQDTFCIPMYIHTKTASSAPNYHFFETAQYITGPTLLLHCEPWAVHTFVRVFLHLAIHFELSAFERGCDIGCGNEPDTHAVEMEVNKGPVIMEDERMTDDIRYTLCHKSGKLWCFNRLRIQLSSYFHFNRVCVLFITTTNVTSPFKGWELKMNSQVKENAKKVCTAQGSPCSSNVGPVMCCAV